MKSFELLRAAAALIEAGGWTQGVDGTGQAVDAADAEGNPVELMVTGSSETGRAAPNPLAVRFSVYGAIAKALHASGGRLEDPARMWDVLATRAAAINGVAHGGTNFVHPIRQFNQTEGCTVFAALALLHACADELEPPAIEIIPPGPQVDPHQAGAEPEPINESVAAILSTITTPRVILGPHPSGDGTVQVEPLKVNRDPGLVAEPDKPLFTFPGDGSVQVEPHHDQLEPSYTIFDKDVAQPYKPMMVPRAIREEHPPALYSGPELDMSRIGPNPFGGDDA